MYIFPHYSLNQMGHFNLRTFFVVEIFGKDFVFQEEDFLWFST